MKTQAMKVRRLQPQTTHALEVGSVQGSERSREISTEYLIDKIVKSSRNAALSRQPVETALGAILRGETQSDPDHISSGDESHLPLVMPSRSTLASPTLKLVPEPVEEVSQRETEYPMKIEAEARFQEEQREEQIDQALERLAIERNKPTLFGWAAKRLRSISDGIDSLLPKNFQIMQFMRRNSALVSAAAFLSILPGLAGLHKADRQSALEQDRMELQANVTSNKNNALLAMIHEVEKAPQQEAQAEPAPEAPQTPEHDKLIDVFDGDASEMKTFLVGVFGDDPNLDTLGCIAEGMPAPVQAGDHVGFAAGKLANWGVITPEQSQAIYTANEANPGLNLNAAINAHVPEGDRAYAKGVAAASFCDGAISDALIMTAESLQNQTAPGADTQEEVPELEFEEPETPNNMTESNFGPSADDDLELDAPLLTPFNEDNTLKTGMNFNPDTLKRKWAAAFEGARNANSADDLSQVANFIADNYNDEMADLFEADVENAGMNQWQYLA
ncbi:hypothetical protein HOD30_05360 [Candidatus Peregrinibacteria bacterium]|nr:hypothetical protein [Candidatus Peregrinibacteria bacterium]MBT4631449.1 hypothetical protein [Candidatus Peregrinibacteria bacterium]MBT5516902.1 hypothetical protein [Candidatus Peregrinibacteria bacterium]MBT5823838.1 hypothetical protein [Candidatus Peregrinibacteria bacterium]